MNYDVLKSTYGYSLVGGYLKGAKPDVFDSNTTNREIGIAVLGENYDFNNKSLVDITKYASPSVSCGTLSTLIDMGLEKIDNVILQAEGAFGPNKAREKVEYLTRFTNDLLRASVPIAYAEGADDDELKEDISVLLKQSKEEFEKRVEENEKEIQEEKENATQDEQGIPEEGEDTEDDMSSDDTQMEDTEDDFFDDETNEDDSENNDEDNEEDDGWDTEGDEPESDENSEDDGQENEENDVDDNDIPDGNLEGNSEDYNGFRDKKNRLLALYNSNVPYRENEKYLVGESFTNIPLPQLKAMSEELLKIEEENFKAIGEQFSFESIKPDSKLSLAHKKYVEANASIMVMKRKLDVL